MMPLPKDNLTYPVLISIAGGGGGSGFFLNTEHAVYLVTACHVLFRNRLEVILDAVTLTSLTSDFASKAVMQLDCAQLYADGHLKKHDRADVAVCRLGAFTSPNRMITTLPGVTITTPPPAGTLIMGLSISNTRKLEEVAISGDIFLFGYPTSLGREGQLDKAVPLLRKGIVAGKTQDGRLVVDCPVYFGNSGGLVIDVSVGPDQTFYRGVGIAVEMIPFIEELYSKQFKAQTGIRYENSGYSIVEPMDRILELL